MTEIVFWLAAGVTGFVALAVVAILGRTAVRLAFKSRLDRRVAAIDRILREHEKRQFDAIDRMMFELGDIHDSSAVENAMESLLAGEKIASWPQLRRVFESLGLVDRYLHTFEHSTKWTERTAAAQALGILGVVEAIPMLVTAMRDPHEDPNSVKLAATKALGMLKAEAAIPYLIDELKAQDTWASPRLAELLCGFGDLAVPALRNALLDNEHPNARAWALQILGRIGSPSSVSDVAGLLHDRSERVRMAAAHALGRLRDREAIDALVRVCMWDPAAPVRAESARALGEIGDEAAIDSLVMMLADHDYWTRLRAIEAIEMVRPANATVLEEALGDPSEAVSSRAALALERIGVLRTRVVELASKDRAAVARATETLTRLGRAGLVESLLGFIDHEDMRVRSRLCKILGDIGDAAAVEVIKPLLRDEAWPVRVRAVEALEALAPEDGFSVLLQSLVDPEETVRIAAVGAIRTLGVPPDPAEVGKVVRLFNEGNAEVRCSVIESIGSLDMDVVNRLLGEALVDPNAAVRLTATLAVAGRGDERWTEKLIEALADADAAVRIAAVKGLGAIGSAAAFAALARTVSTPDRDVREAVTDVLAALGAERLMEMVAVPDELEARLSLIWALGKAGGPAAMTALEHLAGDREAQARASVCGAVTKLGGQRAETVLARLVTDPNERVRAAAVNGLAGVGATGRVDDLVVALDDPDEFVRNRAALALGRLGGPAAEAGLARAYQQAGDPRARAFAVIGSALLGSEAACARALAGIADPELRPQVVALVLAEPDEVQERFRLNLHLDRKHLDPQARPESTRDLAEHFASELRNNRLPGNRVAAMLALQKLGAEDHLELLLSVVRTDPEPEVRRLALACLARFTSDDRVISALAQALKDPIEAVQVAAAQSLCDAGVRGVAGDLLSCFAQGKPALNRALVAALVATTRETPEALVELLRSRDDELTRCAGAEVLGAIRSTVGVPLLEAWLASPQERLRASAARAMASLGSPRAQEALRACIYDPCEEVRMAAAEALAVAPNASSHEALLLLARDPAPDVRRQLAANLRQGLDDFTLNLASNLAADPAEPVRDAALLSLLALTDDGQAKERFLDFLEKQPAGVLPPALASLEDSHPAVVATVEHARAARDPRARIAALRALTALDIRPVDLLIRAMADPNAQVRIAAAKAAAGSKAPELAQALEKLLRDPDPSVRADVWRGRVKVIG